MEEIQLHSMIKKYFCKDLIFELDKLSMMHDVDNNSKSIVLQQTLRAYNVDFSPLGSGTNRFAILIEDYCFKFALDEDGKTDNKREFIYSKAAQPYVIKFYECMLNGLIGVCEYVEVFTEDDFNMSSNQIAMRKILKILNETFLIGDIGITTKNYENWGYRQTDGAIIILDFAYIYQLSYQVFQCTCEDRGILYYDNDYNYLICPFCKKKHSFRDVRRRIPRKQEQDEIGDIRTKGYTVKEEYSMVPLNPKFTDVPKKKVKKEKPVDTKKKSQYDSLEDYQPTADEMLEKYMKGDN
jgi:hypothetical protein